MHLIRDVGTDLKLIICKVQSLDLHIYKWSSCLFPSDIETSHFREVNNEAELVDDISDKCSC